jgi:hypothetical protein
VGLINDIIEDLGNLGAFKKKEEPDRIGDDVYEATKLFTHVRLDGELQSGLTSYAGGPNYNIVI